MDNTASKRQVIVVLKETKDGVKYFDTASEIKSLGEAVYEAMSDVWGDKNNLPVGETCIIMF